jgi:hypothetical protein
MSTSPRPRETIPTPARRYWREFRIQFLPWIAFAILVVVIAALWDSVIVPRDAVPSDPAPITDPGSGDDAPAPAAKDSALLGTNAVTGLGSAKE